MNDVNELMMDMDAGNRSPAGLFVGDTKAKALIELAHGFIKIGKVAHEASCDGSDADCHGDNPHILALLKNYFICHPELTEMERLGITATLFWKIGQEAAEQRAEIREVLEGGIDGILKDIVQGMRDGKKKEDHDS